MRYAEEEEMIVSAARMKMVLNSHKGSIENCTIPQIVKLAQDELKEMIIAYNEDKFDQAITEAGDCFNFLLAAVRKAKTGYRNRK